MGIVPVLVLATTTPTRHAMSNPDTDFYTDVVFSQGILFDLSIGRWMAIRKLDKTDLLLGSIDPDAIHLGHKKLIPREAIAKLAGIIGKARGALNSCSSDFPIAGARFVRFPVLPELLTTLKSLKQEFYAEVNVLMGQYHKLREDQLKVLNAQARVLAEERISKMEKADEKASVKMWMEDQFQKNEQAFPHPDKLKEKFKFEWLMFKVSSANSLNGISAEDALEASQKLQQDLQGWIHETAILMHKTLGEAAAHAKDLLEKQGKLNPKNLKPLFDAFEVFKSIDFAGSDIQKQLEAIKKQFAYVKAEGKIDYEISADMLNVNDTAKKDLQALLGTIGNLAVDKIAKEAGEKALANLQGFKRKLDLA